MDRSSNGTTGIDRRGGNSQGGPENPLAIYRALEIYAALLGSLFGAFIVLHWLRRLSVRTGGLSWAPRPIVSGSRAARGLLMHRAPGLGSVGRVLLIIVFVAINVGLPFYQVDMNSLGHIGGRFGWFAVANLALLVFLALKNTPLAFLTAYSYERLNWLHQVAGYTMFADMLIHATLYTVYFYRKGPGWLIKVFSRLSDQFGIAAGFAFLIVVFAAVFIRQSCYEIFYVIHVSLFMVGIVLLGFHQPKLAEKILIVTILAASLWVADRLLRTTRLIVYSFNNEATLHALPNGGTKILMKKTPARAVPGKHCFIRIPSIRKLETHPFTIVRTDPLEFVVRARDGFTSDLYKMASDFPGTNVAASIDGPYGTFPDPTMFNKVVLVAGGGGATFTFGLAVYVLERMQKHTETTIIFIWAVKKHEDLSWFHDHLTTLRTHEHSDKVSTSIYLTQAPQPTSSLQAQPPQAIRHHRSVSFPQSDAMPRPLDRQSKSDQDKAHEQDLVNRPGTTSESILDAHSPPRESKPELKTGRPDVALLIRDAVNNTIKDHRVLVAACGPPALTKVVQDTTAMLMCGDGPSLELHCEKFEW